MVNKKITIGIVSPSAPIAAFCPKRLARGVGELKTMGFNVKLGKHVSDHTGFTAGTIENRIVDIHTMFLDNEVDVILTTIGGYNANDLLDHLDYSLIAEHNEKIFIGYSDISILLAVLQEKSGVNCILGPMLLPQFAEFGGTLPFTKESFLKVIEGINSGVVYELPTSKMWTEEFTPWDSKDNRDRVQHENQGWQIVREGNAEGKLMGGNLRTLLITAGTQYFPNLDNSILFLEDDSEESASTICRMLQQVKHMGLFEKVKGIVFGRFQKESSLSLEGLKNVCDLVGIPAHIPVIMGVDFGHTDPMLSLPLGKDVHLNTGDLSIKIGL